MGLAQTTPSGVTLMTRTVQGRDGTYLQHDAAKGIHVC